MSDQADELKKQFIKDCKEGNEQNLNQYFNSSYMSHYYFNLGFSFACHYDHIGVVKAFLLFEENNFKKSSFYIDFDAHMEEAPDVPFGHFLSACYNGAYQVIHFLISENYIFLGKDLKSYLNEQKMYHIIDMFEKTAQFEELSIKLNTQTAPIKQRKI